MKRIMISCVALAAFAVPALAGGPNNGANSNASPMGAVRSAALPGSVGQVLPTIVQSYTPSHSPLNPAPMSSNVDDGESYGQALQETQPGAPNGWTCSSGLC
jgi:hypothetical protein